MIAHVAQFEHEIVALEQKAKELYSKRKNVVFYGSSSIRLWETLEADFPEYTIANLGFGGSSIVACTYFFDRVVPQCNPESIIFYAGDNDIGNGADAKDIVRRFKTFLKMCDRHLEGIPVTFVSIKPSVERAHLVPIIQAANKAVKVMIKKRANTYFLNVHKHMLEKDGSVRRDIFIEDMLHLNKKGYELWKEIFRRKEGERVFV